MMLTQLSPVHFNTDPRTLDSEVEEEGRRVNAYYMKIMLEAGADPSLVSHAGSGYWQSTFEEAINTGSVVSRPLLIP